MGLFDKMKNKVAQMTGQQAEPEAQQQHQHQQPQYAAPEPEPEQDDDADEDADEADDWGGWDPNDHQGYWRRLKQIETAGNNGGDEACDAKCRELGLRDYSHMQRVRDTFQKHFGDNHDFSQAAVQAAMQEQRDAMGSAASQNQEIFAPVEGVTLEHYATTQAKAATIGGDMGKWSQILQEAGFDQAKWERVSGEWTRRMSGQASGDMNATMALLTEYSKYFGQAGQGQYGATAAANAGGAGVYSAAGGGAVGAEPCTLERYAEIGGAQSAWAQQGRDVNAMLQQQFGMNALDWSNISQYWSAKFMADYRIAGRYGDLLTHYTEQYMAAGGGNPDSDIDI
ncbi:MAG: hypothetical protein H0V17_09545 [Deltaproteobacteria bacterium]|nr:hypothetical protein [Deltaproteobacteria bacterium]